MKYRTYYGNFDGIRSGLVIAVSQKKAAKIAGISMYEFDRYWAEGQSRPELGLKPETLYVRSYQWHGKAWGLGEWHEWKGLAHERELDKRP